MIILCSISGGDLGNGRDTSANPGFPGEEYDRRNVQLKYARLGTLDAQQYINISAYLQACGFNWGTG